jgi:NADH-quinone oxidoreductase subunit B
MDEVNQTNDGIPDTTLIESNAIAEFLKKTKLQDIINWGRKNSLWFTVNAMGCCGVEEIAVGMAHFDTDRFGIIPRNSPRHADVLIISGYVTKKYLSRLCKGYMGSDACTKVGDGHRGLCHKRRAFLRIL